VIKERSNKEVEWVECGKVGRAIGLKGECAVYWNNAECPVDVDEEIFLAAGNKEKYIPYKIAALRKQGRSSVVRFKDITDREAAASLTGSYLYITSDQLAELSSGHYYSYQILGMDVETEDGRELGKIVRIFTAGDNDVYEVMPSGGKSGDEILIPAISQVVKKVDVDKKIMIIDPLEGMLE
jgi:16S rRNA processing protein RimM